jgi:hypothetical protein
MSRTRRIFRIAHLVAALLSVSLLMATGLAPADEALPAKANLIPEFDKLGLAPLAQGDRDVCSLFAITGVAEFESARHTPGAHGRLSEEYLIWAAKDASGKTRDQSMFFEAVQGLNVLGICHADKMPYESTPDPKEKPTPSALADSKVLRERWRPIWIKRWSVDEKLTDRELKEIKQSLLAGHPVACGLRWPIKLDGSELLDVPPPNKVSDGHSIVFVGFEDDAKKNGGGILRFRNSYGPKWGDSGCGVMSFAYAHAYANDAVSLRCEASNSEVPAIRFEAASLRVVAKDRCEVNVQKMDDFEPKLWSRGKQLFCGAKKDGAVELEIDVPKAARYRLRVLATAAPDFGTVRASLDGQPPRTFDLYSGRVSPSGSLELGTFDFSAGKHRLRFISVGKNPASQGFAFGLDAIDLLEPE